MFSPATRSWFESTFAAPTPAQLEGWQAIASGRHTLIHAPTGSGKTLAAFLWGIDALMNRPQPDTAVRCRLLYVSPLKALAHDVDRNLRAPLLGIRHAAERTGSPPPPDLTTFLRTGDTPAVARRKMQRHPPDILITTPESLYLLLTSAAREVLRSVETVVIDEVHAIANSKRGAHLALSLERLEELCAIPPQRIGLSATQRPLEVIGSFLGGRDREGAPRPVELVDIPPDRSLEVEIVVPVEDMAEPAPPDPLALPDDQPRAKSIWPAVYPRLVELIRANRSTIVFANSRRLAERICGEINAIAGEELARAHHGSVARDQRVEIEEMLKRGQLRAVVATSSLELGIDMGAVDLVIQIEAPISVASGLQRVGRSGHQVGGTSVAKIFPKYRGDLLVATVVADRMANGEIEPTVIPRNPLDVLAQHLVAAASIEDRTAGDLFELVRRAAPFHDLGRRVFEATLDMLAGRYPSDLFAELRPRLIWDRHTDVVTARPGARQLAIANAGTIPDRGLYRVVLPGGGRVGELDEEMVYESRVGDVFVLGATAWRIADIGPDRVEVIPAPGEPTAKLPFWHGDSLGRSYETGRAIGRFLRELVDTEPDEREAHLVAHLRLDPFAAKNLVAYVEEELEAAGTVPSDRTIVVQRFRDEIGDWRVVVLSPHGARVHAPWAMALLQRYRETQGRDVDVIWSDDGIAFRFADADEVPGAESVLIDPDEVEALLVDHLGESSLFAARFREAAARSLLLPRRRPDQRTPLWLQRRRAADLLSVAKGFGDFPIVLESYREVLQDDFDLDALKTLLSDISARRVRVAEVDLPLPSPFASSLLFAFVASFLYEADTPLAERRASALTLDRRLLAELLGEGELRQLFTADVIEALEHELQALSRPRAGKEGLADLLRLLGPLTTDEAALRIQEEDSVDLLAELEAERRVISIRIAGSDMWAAVEDAGRLRDAVGAQPPPGIAHAHLEPVHDPLGDVIGRYARTHGPFAARDVAARFGLPIGVVDAALDRLQTERRVSRGAFTPGGQEQEWIDLEVLRRLKRRTLAGLRSEIEASEPSALGRFLPGWHQISDRPARGRNALVDALRRLQGAEIPASVFESEIVGRRVEDPSRLIDELLLSGDLVWLGRGALGAADGRVTMAFRDRLHLLPPLDLDAPDSPTHSAIREALRSRGASFFRDLYEAAGGGDPEAALSALWDLVWAGEVTNDTAAPLRAFVNRSRRGRPVGRPSLNSSFPPHSAGRWSLVEPIAVDPTVRTAGWAELLLDRHGMVARTTVAAERSAGGFSALYPVFQRLEETGRVRRGYFVETLGGAQFALPGAVDRLRSPDPTGVTWLAATDPANPYGAALGWPETEGRPSRSAGAIVLLAEGRLAAFHDRTKLITFEEGIEVECAAELASLSRVRGRLTVDTVNGQPVAGTQWYRVLIDAGFSPTHRGLRARG